MNGQDLMQGSRQNLAVMFTDVAGFTSMMENSETKALEALELIRSIQQPLLEEVGGELIKEMGDGTLSIFEKPSQAMKCARELQRELKRESFSIRIGIHWGNVLRMGDDVLGDPVNVASRLQELAPPGGICISRELLRNYGPGRRPSVSSMGLTKLKGLGRLVDLFAVKGTVERPLPFDRSGTGVSAVKHATGTHVSIAVMPLVNLGSSGDDFFAHSISADLVSDLSKAGRVMITPMSDVIRLQKAVGGTEAVIERLKVRYMVKGTLWRKEEQFHLSIELHDLPEDRLVWADNWMEAWYDLPSIKGKIADGLLKVLGIDTGGLPGVTDSESPRSEPYEKYLKASEMFRKRKSSSDIDEARRLLNEALRIDPVMVPALILLGRIQSESGQYTNAEKTLARACDTAIDKGDRSGHLKALSSFGFNQWRQSDYRAARVTFQRTLRLATALNDIPGRAVALSNIGLMDSNMGRYESALKYLEEALSVAGDDVSSMRANTLCNIGFTHWHRGNNELALSYYNTAIGLYRTLEDFSGQAYMLRNIGIIKRSTGRCQEALEMSKRALKIYLDLGDRQGQCHSLNSLGNVYMFLGMYEDAMTEYEKALEIAQESDDWLTTSILKSNIGSILWFRNKYADALEIHREALEISERIGDLEGEADTYELLGNDHMELGNFRQAKQAFHNSIDLMESLGSHSKSAKARLKLALLELEHSCGSEVEKRVREYVSVVEEMLTPGISDRTSILWDLSRIYLGLSARTEPDAAREMVEISDRYVRNAHDCMMESADSIRDESLRRAFLENKKHHRDIAEAFARVNGEGSHG